MKRLITDLDYIKLYAEKLKQDNSHFFQQKIFIESQFKASQSLFRNAFKDNFKKEAREYLRKRELI